MRSFYRFIVFLFLVTFLFDDSCGFARPVPPVEKLPNVELINQEGKSVQLKDFEGKSVLMSFIFTRCPMPAMCPFITTKMAQVQKLLRPKTSDQVALLSVTFDPGYDTPEVLKEYGNRYQVDFSNWHFVTGEAGDIKKLSDEVDLVYEDRGRGLIDHNMKTVILDKKGGIVNIYHGSGWRVEEVLDTLREITYEK